MKRPVGVETERKYLIKKPDMAFLASVGCDRSGILQTYLRSDDPSLVRRIRQREYDTGFAYSYTEKKAISDICRLETEKCLSKAEYLALLAEGEKSVSKDRYCFPYNNQILELDIYPGWEDTAILEIELMDESQTPDIPAWILVLREVTGDPAFLNVNLAK